VNRDGISSLTITYFPSNTKYSTSIIAWRNPKHNNNLQFHIGKNIYNYGRSPINPDLLFANQGGPTIGNRLAAIDGFNGCYSFYANGKVNKNGDGGGDVRDTKRCRYFLNSSNFEEQSYVRPTERCVFFVKALKYLFNHTRFNPDETVYDEVYNDAVSFIYNPDLYED